MWQTGGSFGVGSWEEEYTSTLPVSQTVAVVLSVRGRESGANLELEAELSPALRGGNDSQTGEYSQRIWNGPTVRRLTPLECERLQGFPDHWTDIEGNSDTQRYRQLGNAVAVPVVEWLMRRIADAD